MAMPTQRPPFFASFFGAFRARTSPTFQAKSSAPSTTATTITSATSRSITTATSTEQNNTQSQSHSQSIPQSTTTTTTTTTTTSKATSPFSAAAFASTSPGTHTHHSHSHSPFYSPRSPGTSSPTAHAQTIPLTRGRQRRGSDSSNSSGGFMDALSGNEKWYIGGRTAGGDERFYRLGLVTAGGAAGHGRATSLDRLSL